MRAGHDSEQQAKLLKGRKRERKKRKRKNRIMFPGCISSAYIMCMSLRVHEPASEAVVLFVCFIARLDCLYGCCFFRFFLKVVCLVVCLLGWLVECLVGCLLGCLVCRSVVWLINYLLDFCLFGWLDASVASPFCMLNLHSVPSGKRCSSST